MNKSAMDLEAVWALREAQIYPDLFGGRGRGIFPLSAELFTRRFGQSEVDPRWLFHGVFEFAPTPTRRSWAYVTSGLSNPWDQPPETYEFDEESGAGLEFVFQSAQQGDWAIQVLQNMLAYDLLLAAGRFPGRRPLAVGDRIPLNAPIDGRSTCRIRNLVVTDPEGVADGFVLPSGKVRLLSFTGIADPEAEWARANGSDALIPRLRRAGAHPVTDPARRPLF
jgi:hypothetical protein